METLTYIPKDDVLPRFQVLENPFNIESQLLKKEISTPNPLFSDVEDMKRNVYLTGERPYLLKGTGFNPTMQVDRMVRTLREDLFEGKPWEEALNKALREVEEDIKGFKLEYLLQGVLFPINLDVQTINGKNRIKTPLYGNKLWVDSVDEREREGAVKRAIAGNPEKDKKGAEEVLLESESGTVVVTSPPGWSGYDKEYPDTQTYVIQKQKDGRIRGFTIRTGMDLGQNKELLRSLGVTSDLLQGSSERDEIKKTVENFAFLPGSEFSNYSIEDIARRIQIVMKSNIAFIDDDGKPHHFNEVYEGLQDPERLWNLDDKTKEFIDQFNDYVQKTTQDCSLNKDDLTIALGVTILKLSHQIRGPKVKQYNNIPKDNSVFNQRDSKIKPPINFNEVLSDLQTLTGCNGGGIINSITPRVLSKESGKKILCCKCPFCEEQVEAEIANGTINCPKCGKSAPYKDKEKQDTDFDLNEGVLEELDLAA